MDLLDSYYAKSKHTNKERKEFTKYMEKKYREYLDTYHDVKIKYRHLTNEKLTLKEFKNLFKLDYNRSKDTNEVMDSILNKNNLVSVETSDIDVYFKNKEENFNKRIKEIKEKLKNGQPLNQLETIMINVEKKSKRLSSRDFMWKYFQIEKEANILGLTYQRAYDSPGKSETITA